MSDSICNCDTWEFYVRNYNETFYYNPKTNKWYIGWVHLSDQGGYTQVSRYAIPVTYCPLCGGRLKIPDKEDQIDK